jgi:hypothetical protein
MSLILDGTAGVTGPATKVLVGTTTNDSATAGYVGEYISASSSGTSVGANTTWTNTASISLTAGDWDVSLVVVYLRNGALWTEIYAQISSTFSGGGGGTMGDNYIAFAPPPTTADYLPMGIASYRVSIASTTIYYFKTYVAYTVATPNVGYRISARRVR